MWRRAIVYGLLLAAGTLGLQWLDYRHLAHAHTGELYVFLIATAFLGLGLVIGSKVIGAPPLLSFDGNPKGRDALGISPTEMTVLRELAAGYSNKEIAARLRV